MIENLITDLGGVLTQRRESLWATREFTATTEDTKYGLTPGQHYVLWVAQRTGKTQSGKDVTKGDWFTVAKA